MLRKLKISYIISLILILSIVLVSDVYVQNDDANKKVERIITGELIIKKSEKSFKNGLVVISLYKIHRYLADADADLVAEKIVRSFIHKKGKQSKIEFSFKDTDYAIKDYSIYASIYMGNTNKYENEIFRGEIEDGRGYPHIKSNKEHIKFIAKKTKDYPSDGNIKLPATYGAVIPWHPLFFPLPLTATYTINKNKYKLNLYGAKSVKELNEKLCEFDKSKQNDFKKYPPMELDIYFEIKNTSDHLVEVNITSDDTKLKISSSNPNFKSIKTIDGFLTEERNSDGDIIKLKPNETYKWKITLKTGFGGSVYNFFTDKGDYYLKIVQQAQFRENGKFRVTDITIEIPELLITIE